MDRLSDLMLSGKNIVVITGAGISTGSGIPDFRSADGLYTTSEEADPEYMLSHTCLNTEPQRFFEYMRKNMDFRKAEPNIAHLKISELQRARTVSVITQNIDGLHEKAGSKAIANIHGSLASFYCDECGAHHFPTELIYEGQYDSLPERVPRCTECSGSALLRPDITLYGESFDFNNEENQAKVFFSTNFDRAYYVNEDDLYRTIENSDLSDKQKEFMVFNII